jgi:hypothetical protein
MAPSVFARVGVTTLVDKESFGYPSGGGIGPVASTLCDEFRANPTTVATMKIPITMIAIN